MAIPIFNDNARLVDVREQSINPAIQKVNELDTSVTDLKTRLGFTPRTITDLDEVLPSGWYHFTPTGKSSDTKGEGFVQYYTVTAEDGTTHTYARVTFYPKNDNCKYYTREWSHNSWGEWTCIGQGGFRLDPNPPVEGKNLFKAATRAAAEQARNTYFATAENLTPYEEDTMLLIVLEWTEGSKKIVIFQSRSNSSWIEPFGEIATEFQLGNHDVSELRDWATWRDKINESVHTLNNIGGSEGVEVASKTGDAISVNKLAGSPLITVTKKADQTVEFSAKKQWAGVFNSQSDLSSGVSAEDCVESVTIAGVRDGNNGYNLKMWTGTGADKGWKPLEVIGGGLYHGDDGHLKGYQYLQDGPNVVFSHASATGALQINLKDVVTTEQAGEYIKKGELESKPSGWTKIEQVGNKIQIDSKPTVTEFQNFVTSSDDSIQFGMSAGSGGNNKVNITVGKTAFRKTLWEEVSISGSDPLLKSSDFLLSDGGTAPNQYVNFALKRDPIANLLKRNTGDIADAADILKPSTSIDVVKAETSGVPYLSLKVKDSYHGKIQAKLGTGAYQTIKRIDVSSTGSITDDTLRLPVVRGQDRTGKDTGEISVIKQGTGLQFANNAGVLTISRTGVQAQVGESGDAQTLTRIIATNPYADVTNGVLELPVITAIDNNGAEVSKVKNLKQGSGIRFTSTEGTITVSAVGSGGGGGSLSLSGNKVGGGAVGETEITALKLEDGLYLSEDITSGVAKVVGKLEVIGKDYQESGEPEDVSEKTSKIEFSEGLETEVVNTDGKVSIKVLNTNPSKLQASASGGDKTISMESIDQILVVGDAASSYMDTISNKKQLTIEAYTPVIEESSKTKLSSAHPASDNTSRLGFTTDNETLYIGASGQWKDLCYTGMGSAVKSIETRLPQHLEKNGSTYEEDKHKALRVTSISSSSANTDLHIPGGKEGVLIDMYAGDPTSERGAPSWIQKYNTFDGEEFSRCRTGTEGSYSWSSWFKVAKTSVGLEDNNYSVLVMDNDKKMSDLKPLEYQIPYMPHSDPTANIRFVDDGGNFQVLREGQYDITCIALFTNSKDTPLNDGGPAYMEIRKSSDTRNPIANVDFEKSVVYDSTEKEFYPIKGVFKGVTLELGETYHVRVAARNMDDTEMAKIEYDPYKNILAIDPANSRTKTAAGIQKMLFKTMGGLSFSAGAEVRTEVSGSIIRVYGQKYLTEIKEQQVTVAEV